MTEIYAAPVDQLLTYGDPSGETHWPDYLHLGLTSDHIPDLICMATDPEFDQADSESLQVWAPVHAWRALGQLRAEAAVNPLVKLFDRLDDDLDDWLINDLPEALSLIGAAAIPALAAYLEDITHDAQSHEAIIDTLKKLATKYPDQRARVVALLTQALEKFTDNDVFLNSTLIGALVDLRAIESATVIKAAFYADQVDPLYYGTWPDVKAELELDPLAEVPGPEPVNEPYPPLYIEPELVWDSPGIILAIPNDNADLDSEDDPYVFFEPGSIEKTSGTTSKAHKKAKAKRKQEKQSRKQNRKRK